MGQETSLLDKQIHQGSPEKKGGAMNQAKFTRDPRLVEEAMFIPELFAGQIDAEIKKVERLIEALPLHILETEIVDGLNDRFSKTSPETTQSAPIEKNISKTLNLITKKEELLKEMKKYENGYFYELETQDRFMILLKKLQHSFYVQKELNNGMILGKSDKKVTVRKKVLPVYESQLDSLLYSKLFLKYYLLILKINLGSKNKERKNVAMDFHNSIGKMICEMIEHNHLNEKKLFHLSYKIIYLEKVGSQEKLEKTLNEIREEFWPFYLTKEHNLTVKPEEFDRLRQVCRCYLDELYLRSLKEAEDPDIITDFNEGFGIIKNFPVHRVRDEKTGTK